MDELWDWAKTEKLNKDYLKCELFFSKYIVMLITLCCRILPLRKLMSPILWIGNQEVQLTPNEEMNAMSLYTKVSIIIVLFLRILIFILILLGIESGNIETPLWYKVLVSGCVTAPLPYLLIATEHSMYYELFFEGQYEYGASAWNVAAAEGHVEVLEKLWLWTGEVQINSRGLINRLLFGKNVWTKRLAYGSS
jgi:hypothetical protein